MNKEVVDKCPYLEVRLDENRQQFMERETFEKDVLERKLEEL